MKTRNPFAKVLFTTVIIIFLSATSPQDALADNGWRTLVGSWFVEITPEGGPPPFTNLATLDRSGTMVTADPVLGSGHGAWKRIGRRVFETRFLTLIAPDNPLGLPPDTILTVTAFLTVGDSGDEADGTVRGEFADSAGNVLAVIEGGVRFTRIKVD